MPLIVVHFTNYSNPKMSEMPASTNQQEQGAT